jgi:hypothetical protein
MSANSCCLQGFAWDGKQRGTIGTLGDNNAYITGSNSSAAILVIHDLFGVSCQPFRPESFIKHTELVFSLSGPSLTPACWLTTTLKKSGRRSMFLISLLGMSCLWSLC